MRTIKKILVAIINSGIVIIFVSVILLWILPRSPFINSRILHVGVSFESTDIIRSERVTVTPVENASLLVYLNLSRQSVASVARTYHGPLILEKDNICYLNGVSRLLKNPAPQLSDFLPVSSGKEHGIFLISDDSLGWISAEGRIENRISLPFKSMKFGIVKDLHDTSSQLMDSESMLLIFGGENPSAIFLLKRSGLYSKLIETYKPITAAALCSDELYFAMNGSLLLLKFGHQPLLVTVVPENLHDKKIISIVPKAYRRSRNEKQFARSEFYFSTMDAVYMFSHGIAEMLILGLGGYMRPDKDSGIYLLNPQKQTLVHFRERIHPQ